MIRQITGNGPESCKTLEDVRKYHEHLEDGDLEGNGLWDLVRQAVVNAVGETAGRKTRAGRDYKRLRNVMDRVQTRKLNAVKAGKDKLAERLGEQFEGYLLREFAVLDAYDGARQEIAGLRNYERENRSN